MGANSLDPSPKESSGPGVTGAARDDGAFWSTWYPVVAIAATLIASMLAYPHLPPRIAIHWGLHGEPNGWAGRTVGAFLLPDLALALWVFMRWLPRTDPRRANYEAFRGAYTAVVNGAVTLLLVLHLASLAIALGWPLPMTIVVQVMVGSLLVLTGSVLPKARPNWYFGIRTPWTLSSDRVWERTHRLGGPCFVTGGLVMIAAAALPPLPGLALGASAVFIASVVPIVCSYLWWSREGRRDVGWPS